MKQTGKTDDTLNLRVTPSGNLEVPMPNGNVMTIQLPEQDNRRMDAFNISEAMEKSGLWKSMEGSRAHLEDDG